MAGSMVGGWVAGVDARVARETWDGAKEEIGRAIGYLYQSSPIIGYLYAWSWSVDASKNEYLGVEAKGHCKRGGPGVLWC